MKQPHPQISGQHLIHAEEVAFDTNGVIRLARIPPNLRLLVKKLASSGTVCIE